MNISEEKLLEFIEGYLDEEESKQIIQSIENDKELKEQYKLLLEGKQLIDAWHENEIANAPDASITPINAINKVKEKRNNLWNLFPKMSNSGIMAAAASLAIISFIGGSQYANLDKNNFTEIALLKDNQQGIIYRDINHNHNDNAWGKDSWLINDNIGLKIIVSKDDNLEFLENNSIITSDKNIQLFIQVFKKSKITIDMVNDNGKESNILENIFIKPSEVFNTKKYKLKNSIGNNTIIIDSVINDNKKDYKFKFKVVEK